MTVRDRSAFSLVELLIVIAIIGLLFQMMLPAVESAQEAARRIHCKNNLRQLGIAAQTHLSAHNRFPTGGWSHVWIGDPDRGYGAKQPGGWTYNLLAYLEEEAVHDMAKGMSAADKRVALKRMFETPVKILVCPSRRRAVPYPFVRFGTLTNIDNPDTAGRSDYAANIGNLMPSDQRGLGPKSYDDADSWVEGTNRHKNWVAMYHNGIVHQRSLVKPQQVTDGLSQTLLFGEKFLGTNHYKNGKSHGDDQSLYVGFDRDNARSTNELHPPKRDKAVPIVYLRVGDSPKQTDFNFGSAHPAGVPFVFCDGSVRLLDYNIDQAVYSALGSRNGEEVVQGL